MDDNLSRRSVITSGATAIGASFSGCLASDAIEIVPWTPEPSTWPLPRYDVTNSGSNPDATPPREIDTAWSTSVAPSLSGVLVADGVVIGYGERGISAVNVSNGSERWHEDGLVQTAASYGTTVYVAGPADPAADEPAGAVRGYDLADGERVLETTLGESHRQLRFLTVTDEFVLAGDRRNDETIVIERASGETVGTIESGWTVAIDTDRLFLGGDGSISAYAPDDSTSVMSGDEFERQWHVDAWYDEPWTPLAIDASALYSGSFRPGVDQQMSVHGYDRDGQKRWTNEPRGPSASTPAIADDVGYAAQIESGYERSNLVALSSKNGGEQWHRAVERGLHTTIVAGDVVIAYGHGAEIDDEDASETAPEYEGYVLAVDPDGTERWDFETATSVRQVVAVNDRVYVATADGELIALESD